MKEEVDEMCESMTKHFEWAFVTNSNEISKICPKKANKLNPPRTPKIVRSKISVISMPHSISESSFCKNSGAKDKL